jgi:UrcA family protein
MTAGPRDAPFAARRHPDQRRIARCFKLFTSVALAATFAAGAAQAQAPAESGETYSIAVRSADLNLSSADGLATFRGRVRAAASHACGELVEERGGTARASGVREAKSGFPGPPSP